MTGQGSGNLRWVVCEVLRAAGPALLADDGTFRSYVAAWGNQADPLVQAALATVDAQALAPLAQAVQAPDVASFARARYAMHGALCQRGVGEDAARGVASAIAGGAADLFGVALPDMPAQQQVAYPQQQAQYQQQPQQAAYPQQPMYQQAQQPAYPQQHPQQAAYPQPPRKKKFLIPLAIAGGLAGLAAVAALVFFVVLPMLGPKGMWICTSMTSEHVPTEGEPSTTTTEYALDERGRLRSRTIHGTSGTTESSSTTTFSLDDSGMWSTAENWSSDGQSSSFAHSWTKDSKGRIAGVTISGDNVTETVAYEYGPNGHIVKSTYDRTYDNGYTEHGCYEYDSSGLKTTWTLHVIDPSAEGTDTDRQQEQTFEYEKDLAGRVTACNSQVTGSSGELAAEVMETYEYDSDGNISIIHSDVIFYNDDGTTEGWSDTYTYAYEYVEDPDPWVLEQARWHATHLVDACY